MNIVIAPDSFKGSLDSIQASEIMKKAILDVNVKHTVTMNPMADGGEGTIDALMASTKGEMISLECTGPLGERINTNYAIVNSKTAIIEYANIAGLMQVPIDERNPDFTTSFGLGEVILAALDRGCTSFVIGLGGSATNDGGLGMFLALGMKAWNEDGVEVGPYGISLQNIRKVIFAGVDPRLAEVTIKVACDVDNPLCGKRGASEVYGPQKGASKEQVQKYDQSLYNFGNIIESTIDKKLKDVPGAGAAGGVGFALLAIGAHLVSGAELIADAINLEEAIQQADLVITGEGQSDEQTLYGKAPGYIASLADKHKVPAILISGSLAGNLEILRQRFSGCFSIVNKPLSLGECMDQAENLLYEQTKQVIHLVDSFRITTSLLK
ncbi:glycerate kinase [Sporosarcina cascadiensis]|uniref:glycerate kinase n=1 Tax=Sporosarcina cascadiensis TaxID=2660747 RepID=UPI00129BAA0F|nr:glycerate kinase [Sporosarcina cascadiensis]